MKITKIPAPREDKKHPKQKKTLHEAARELKQKYLDEFRDRVRREHAAAHRDEEDELMDMIHGPRQIIAAE